MSPATRSRWSPPPSSSGPGQPAVCDGLTEPTNREVEGVGRHGGGVDQGGGTGSS